MSELRRLRVNARMSINKLAEQSGVSAKQIRNIEDGTTKNPQVETLSRLADALEVQPTEIDPYPYNPKAAA